MSNQLNDQKGSFGAKKPKDVSVPAYAPKGSNARPGTAYPSHGGNGNGGKDNGQMN